jgi:SAM-dependent methyltransferase
MKALRDAGIRLSPFLELGAERGQRSLVLTNDFGADGVAVDISFHQLRTMEHFAGLFARDRLPVRVCCDANHLPFRSNSFPFIFCYQFLHHVPAPRPILSEIHRVLCDGYIYFDEEPFKRVLKLALYRRKSKMYSRRALGENKYVNLIESFISEAPCDEVEHGVIENNNISLAEWIDALSIFGARDVDLVSIYNVTSKLHDRLRLRNVPNYLLGGLIAGLCRKEVRVERDWPQDVSELFGCPGCTTPSVDGGFDRPPLVRISDGYQCPNCGFSYPYRDGILFLLPRGELRQLYPGFDGL